MGYFKPKMVYFGIEWLVISSYLAYSTGKAAYNEIEAIRLWKCGDGDKALTGRGIVLKWC